MDKIELSVPTQTPSGSSYESTVLAEQNFKKKAVKTFMNYAGILVGVFLIFAVIVVMTVDIRLITAEDITSLGLNFFVILFCSYLAYVSCSDSGMRAAFGAEEYNKCIAKYEEKKREVIDKGFQGRMTDFCKHYIAVELRSVRNDLISFVGLSYEEYETKYLGKDKQAVEAEISLSKAQRKAIIRANYVCPVCLTPEMLLKRGRATGRRAPLGITPQKRKGIAFASKFVTNAIISVILAVIVFEVVRNPSWSVFASVVLKLVSVVANGFAGYKTGFENIVVHSSNYLQDQTDLLEQALQYFASQEGTTYGKESPDSPVSSHEDGAE